MTDLVEQAVLAALRTFEEAASTVPNEDYVLFQYLVQACTTQNLWSWEDVQHMEYALRNAMCQVHPHNPLDQLRAAMEVFRAARRAGDWLHINDEIRASHIDRLKDVLATWRQGNLTVVSPAK
jgi:hypothetical protein